jgi:membrane associated rhomboid family serine protease
VCGVDETSLNPNVDASFAAPYGSWVIPLRESRKSQSAPLLTYALIALNAAAFAYQSWLPEDVAEHFLGVFGWTPSHVLDPQNPAVLLTLLTSLFVHGSWFHVLSNLWCLYVFGEAVEDRIGKARFALFYLCAALGAAGAQIVIDPSGEIPMIGASGAIAGLLGVYWKCFPYGRVLTLIPLVFVFVREVPAVYYISLWFMLQLLAGFFGLMGPNEGGILFFAQIGGFLTGVTLIALFRPSRNATRGFRGPEYY